MKNSHGVLVTLKKPMKNLRGVLVNQKKVNPANPVAILGKIHKKKLH